jgi:hypothetical protein
VELPGRTIAPAAGPIGVDHDALSVSMLCLWPAKTVAVTTPSAASTRWAAKVVEGVQVLALVQAAQRRRRRRGRK